MGRRTRSQVAQLVADYQAGRYVPRDRRERFWLEQRARSFAGGAS